MGLVSTAALGIPGGMHSFLDAVAARTAFAGPRGALARSAEDAVAIALGVVLTR